MVWPTVGSRTAEEQNRTCQPVCLYRQRHHDSTVIQQQQAMYTNSFAQPHFRVVVRPTAAAATQIIGVVVARDVIGDVIVAPRVVRDDVIVMASARVSHWRTDGRVVGETESSRGELTNSVDVRANWLQSSIAKLRCKSKKGSPHSTAERRVHKPGGRLPLLSARPAVTPATIKRGCCEFRCLVNRGTTGVNSRPKTVTRQRRGCDLNPGPSARESSTLTTRLPSQPRSAITKPSL